MKKFSLMLASVLMAGTMFGVCACGANNGGNDDLTVTPKIEGNFTTLADEKEITEKAGTIDLQAAFLGADPTSWNLGANVSESLKLSGKLSVGFNADDVPFDSLSVNLKELSETMNYLINVSSDETDGLSISADGGLKLGVDAEAPAALVVYLDYVLSSALGSATTQPEMPQDANKATPVKANAEAKINITNYNQSNDQNYLHANIASANLTLGSHKTDFLASDGILQGHNKLYAELNSLLGGIQSGMPTALAATSDGPLSAFTLGQILLMVNQLGGKVYFDVTSGLKVKVTVDLLKLAEGIYSFVTTGTDFADEDAIAEFDNYLTGVTFSKHTADIYLELDSNNLFKKAALSIDIAVSRLSLAFTGVSITGTDLSLSISAGVEKTTETVKPFSDLNTYVDVMSLFSGSGSAPYPDKDTDYNEPEYNDPDYKDPTTDEDVASGQPESKE